MNHTKWIERQFNFNFLLGVVPNIIERLRGTTLRINAMIQHLSGEKLMQSFLNKWSIKQEVAHLSFIEDLHLARITDFVARKEILCAADMTNAETNNADSNGITTQDLLSNFTSKRSFVVTKLSVLNDETLHFKSLHPRLRIMMRPIDMAFFIVEYDDHHLVTIRQILKNF